MQNDVLKNCPVNFIYQLKVLRDFTAGVFLSEVRNPIPPPHTEYVYTIFKQERGEGGELNQWEGDKGYSLKSWVENTNMTDCISINSDKYLPQSPFSGNFLQSLFLVIFLDDDILLWCLYC